MIHQGGAASAMAGLRTTYATVVVPKGWAGHHLEMRNSVGPFIAMAPVPPAAGASIFEGVGGDRGNPGFADKVLDDLTLRSKMASSLVLGGPVPPLEVTSSEELADPCMNPKQHIAVSEQKLRAKRKLNAGKDYTLSENPKKIQRNTRNAKSKRTQKSVKSSGEEENHTSPNRQSSSCDSSEDDSNASLELNRASTSSCSKGSATTSNPNGKTRASRGSTTDPVSIYARKRRERINDRLRILQGRVPNGTKVVDISTMLEDAVQYVKFLQLQIKLLSSDDLWMYSPIAYNGMNIALDLIMARTK